ncbi:MAG: phage shock protein operon transcriptional activator [Deltaproteobacteria bacterium]|jgi:psp operon transcriptional activator|nr:phage shock protein operon transcriptional activator [Deltaproteobacteria bacterium]
MKNTSSKFVTPAPGVEAIGQSEAFLMFQESLSKVAAVNRPVLLLGERGTGKELAAMRLHYLSPRWQEPLVALNCAALSPSLIETELFGHEKGAFTGAFQSRKGRFEAAENGTLFLDEIGSIPLEVQEKILRVVEVGSFERVGGSLPVDVDVRLVGATNADLLDLTARGLFKRDLLDRLSFEVLFLPPLREREGDMLLLADHFARRMAYELGREKTPVFSREASTLIEEYHWPGNVRELKNVVERAVYRTDSARITKIDFNPFISPYKMPADAAPPEKKRPFVEAPQPGLPSLHLKEAVRGLEIRLLKTALEASKYNQKKAAVKLGLTYDQLRGLLKKHAKALEDLNA